MSNNAHELSNRLVNALDNNYNVVDMHTVNEIISILEKFNITKELLETTRLGKHVNELRRKTTDPALARRAKVLVKRWRDLVIPTVASPGNPGSNRSSAERSTVRRLGGTPLTSPALSRQVVSPAVPSPRPVSRPAWGGYESDSQDVILVDDDPPPPPPPPPHNTLTPPVKRPPSPQPLDDEKKAKRDKKPKKRRGHSRAGSGTETAGAAAGGPWRDRNGAGAGPERRRNGCTNHLDPYTALVNRMPKAGDKKVKTTQELLAQIQQRGARPHSPHSPHSPDVMLIENDSHTIKVESPLRNGSSPACEPTPQPTLPPLEDEREYHECTCGDSPLDSCPAARRTEVTPLHIAALHHAYLPGINGTRAPLHPHQFTVRTPADPDRPGLFANVVPLYKYSDYADDYCVKNMFRVPLCEHLPWTEFAPDPPPLPPPPSPPPLRPYPIDANEVKTELVEVKKEVEDDDTTDSETVKAEVKSEVDPNERLSPSIVEPTPEEPPVVSEPCETMEVEEAFETEHQDHRTVERTKDKDGDGPCENAASNIERTCENAASNVERTCENAASKDLNGQALYDMVRRAAEDIPYDYGQMYSTPVVTLPQDEYEATETLEAALLRAEEETARDELGRPPRSVTFSEWHECARLGDLVALPYVVID